MRWLLFIFLLIWPVKVFACDCAVPIVDNDKDILENSVVVGRFMVLDLPAFNGSNDSTVVVTLRVQNLFKGDMNMLTPEMDIRVLYNYSDGCSRYIKQGEIYDLPLVREESSERLTISEQCHELSEDGWSNLKSRKSVLDVTHVGKIFGQFDYRKYEIGYDVFKGWYEDENTVILDLRSLGAYNHSHIKGAAHLGADIDEKRLEEIVPSKDTRIIVYCSNSLMATRMMSLTHVSLPQLHALGYRNAYMLGAVWKEAEGKSGSFSGDARELFPMTQSQD